MQLNLPILEQVKDSQNILIAGAGGGFDVFSGLPIYFALRQAGKRVHLANYSFNDFRILPVLSSPLIEIPDMLAAARGSIKRNFNYYPEGYLSQWFLNELGEETLVWMFARQGVLPLKQAYAHLVEKLGIDAIIAVDGGVDSLMRGDEHSPGTLLEDSLSLAAISSLDIPVKILAAIGFGTEVEEALCHHHALENMAALMKEGAFLGSCALTKQMPVFQLFESACRYVWEQPDHHISHISSRIIPAVNGEFDDFHLYPRESRTRVFISPLMSLYWFFDLGAVARRNLIIPLIQNTLLQEDAMRICLHYRATYKGLRPRKTIPY